MLINIENELPFDKFGSNIIQTCKFRPLKIQIFLE